MENKNIENMYGINYSKPKVTLLQETGIGVSEVAARTCYDSFENSENSCIYDFGELSLEDMVDYELEEHLKSVNGIESSDLLTNLAWVHHHHSILEHTNLSFLIKGTSRGVLQEHARHRIQAISVRSTRYTMSSVINAFVASFTSFYSKAFFIHKIIGFDLFVTTDLEYNVIEAGNIFDKLMLQYENLGKDEFMKLAVAKSSLDFIEQILEAPDLFDKLENGKKKRNVGDAFKHVVSDVWKVDMIVTFNIRSLKNYFQLRDSGAAWFQIRWLAQEMKKVTPKKYLNLIVKEK